MNPVTLETIEKSHAETAALIERYKQQSQKQTLALPAIDICLQPGERYAGPVLDEHGRIKHHLVLLVARPDEDLNWKSAKAWAEKAGGTLPSRQEQALLFANCKAALPQCWCWSSEAEGSSYAWGCHFGYGCQYYHDFQSFEACAVAVRRFNP